MKKTVFAITAVSVVMMTGCALTSKTTQVPEVEHVVIFQKDGIFAAWPANNGAWIWEDDEMLVGFTVGAIEVQPSHNIGPDQNSLLARSTDGGKTWQTSQAPPYLLHDADLKTLDKPIDFTRKGFALKVIGTGYHAHYAAKGAFYYTYDRGATWQGPYPFTGLTDTPAIRQIVDVNIEQWPSKKAASAEWKEFELTPRTDYIIINDKEALVFVSTRPQGPDSFATDRLFCARTTNGGLSFEFVSWVVPPSDPYRAAMSQTVHVSDRTMVSVARRRMQNESNWIDAYATTDGGKSWSFQGRIGTAGDWNGNPPALAKTGDGRLCCIFGDRQTVAIMASYSADNGKTWTEPTAIRSGDFYGLDDEPDLGYPRLLKRSDGMMVAIYYWSTKEHPHNISATLWKP